jgi:hypothetical protein
MSSHCIPCSVVGIIKDLATQYALSDSQGFILYLWFHLLGVAILEGFFSPSNEIVVCTLLVTWSC